MFKNYDYSEKAYHRISKGLYLFISVSLSLLAVFFLQVLLSDTYYYIYGVVENVFNDHFMLFSSDFFSDVGRVVSSIAGVVLSLVYDIKLSTVFNDDENAFTVIDYLFSMLFCLLGIFGVALILGVVTFIISAILMAIAIIAAFVILIFVVLFGDD